jgi:hypothetical protein
LIYVEPLLEKKSMKGQTIMHAIKSASPWFMIFNPLTTTAFHERPRWLLPILISGILSSLVNLYIVHRIGFVRLVEAVTHEKALIDAQGVVENALANKNQILAIQAATSFIGPFLMAAAIATGLWLLLMLLGHNISFKTNLAITAHANMPTIVIRALMLAVTVTIIPNINNFDMNNPLATNLAFFLKPVSPPLLRLFSSLDALTFLNIVLLILGLTRACPQLPKGTATLMITIPWMIYLGCILAAPIFLS